MYYYHYPYDIYDPRMGPKTKPYPSLPSVNPAVVNTQILQGRIGHYFQSSIPGFGLLTFQLVDFNPFTRTVGISVEGQYMQVSSDDMVGLIYLGPTPPKPKPPWCAQFPTAPGC